MVDKTLKIEGFALEPLFLKAVDNGDGTSTLKVVPDAGGPLTVTRLLSSAAGTNPTSVKASAGKLMKAIGFNTVASPRFLKLFDKATAPTVGTDVPVVTIYLPPNAPFSFDLGDIGHVFSTGIAFAITGAASDADATAIAAGDISCMNLFTL